MRSIILQVGIVSPGFAGQDAPTPLGATKARSSNLLWESCVWCWLWKHMLWSFSLQVCFSPDSVGPNDPRRSVCSGPLGEGTLRRCVRCQLYVYDLQRKAGLSLGDPAALQENYSVPPGVSPGFWRGHGIEDLDLVHVDLAFQGVVLDARAEPSGIDRYLMSSWCL